MKLTELVRLPWAILPAALDNIVRECAAHRAQPKIDHAPLKDAYFARRADRLRTVAGAVGDYRKMLNQFFAEQSSYVVAEGGVAVLMITGPVTKNYELITWYMDGTSTAAIAAGFKAALADQRVKSIMLYIDSPGGHVDGTQELANLIYSSRGGKPVIAFSDGGVYSAAMYIAAAADRLLISGDMAGVGSIGVIATHIDISKAEEAMGIKVTEIYAGKYKGVGSPHRPLSDSDKAIYQAEIDQMYSTFVNDVAKYRGTTPEDVLSRMADGLTFLGTQGIEAGLVDGVSTMDQLLADMAAGVVVGLGSAPAVPVAETAVNQKEIQAMDIKELQAKHPDVYAAVVAEGRALAMEEGKKAGAEAERTRIAAIREITIPGHEAIAEEAIKSGMSVGAYAIAQSRTEKEVAAAALKAQREEAPAPQPGSGPPAEGAASAATPEQKEKAAWEKDEKLRADYNGDFAAYQAYNRAVQSGRVKVKGTEE